MAQKRPRRGRSRDASDEAAADAADAAHTAASDPAAAAPAAAAISDPLPASPAAAGRRWPPESAPPSARSPSPSPAGPSTPATSSPQARPPGREIRPYIYAGFDFAMVVIYALVLTQVPTRHPFHAILLWSTVGAMAVAGAGMLWRSPWGRRAALAGCAVLIAVAILVLVLILLSASFLAGVYGSMGSGAASMALVAGALAIELFGFLPALQIKFLMTRAGRRHFAGTPGPGPAR